MQNIIKDAILNQSLIEFLYKDELRVVEPYTFGMNTRGNDVLSAYQIEGGSSSSEDLGWRLFSLNKINNLKLLDTKFSEIRSEYNPNDSRMQHIYAGI